MRHGRGKQMYPHGDLYDGGWELNKVEQVFGVWKKYVYLNAHMHAHARTHTHTHTHMHTHTCTHTHTYHSFIALWEGEAGTVDRGSV